MLREDLVSFPELHHAEFQHPLDRETTGILKNIDKFRPVIATLNMYVEHSMKYHHVSSCVQVSEKQYPSLYRAFVRSAQALDVRKMPTLFIETVSEINAYASGIEHYSMTLNSALMDILTERELMAIIGHELGHVKCDHMFYNTFTYFVRYFGSSVTGVIPPPFNSVLDLSVQLALLEWSRRAEFSADRAALLATQDIEAVTQALGKIAGYSKTLSDPISIEALREQANSFEEYVDDNWMAKFIKVQSMLSMTHPYTVLRVKEIAAWAESDHYKQIMSGNYQKLAAALPPASDAPAEQNRIDGPAVQKAAAALGSSLTSGLKSFGGFGKKATGADDAT